MVLKLNEYVRTKDEIIAKVIGVQSGGIEKYFFDKEIHKLLNFLSQLSAENVISKHSFNIIDLIEEGDYVNGDKIVKIEEDIYIGGLNLWTERDVPDGFGGFYRVKYREKDIKFVVTHEQMEAMEYEVK